MTGVVFRLKSMANENDFITLQEQANAFFYDLMTSVSKLVTKNRPTTSTAYGWFQKYLDNMQITSTSVLPQEKIEDIYLLLVIFVNFYNDSDSWLRDEETNEKIEDNEKDCEYRCSLIEKLLEGYRQCCYKTGWRTRQLDEVVLKPVLLIIFGVSEECFPKIMVCTCFNEVL